MLAGANRRAETTSDEDDGILTAEEIAGLDLSAAQWAVLSACDTGRGDLQAGEGVVGFRRAFQVAGARTVILSLWPVLDTVAADWMAELYRGKFVRGDTTAAFGPRRQPLAPRRAPRRRPEHASALLERLHRHRRLALSASRPRSAPLSRVRSEDRNHAAVPLSIVVSSRWCESSQSS